MSRDVTIGVFIVSFVVVNGYKHSVGNRTSGLGTYMQSENMKDLNTSAMVAKDTYDKWYYNNVEWGDHEMHAPEQSIWLYPKSPYFNFPMKNRTTVNGMGKYERTPEEIVTSRTTYATREKDMLMQQFDIKEKITNNGVNTCIHQADVPE